MLATRAIIAPSRIAVVSTAGSTPASSSFGRLASRPNPRPKYRTPVMKSRTVPEDLRRDGRPYDPLANQQCRLHAFSCARPTPGPSPRAVDPGDYAGLPDAGAALGSFRDRHSDPVD